MNSEKQELTLQTNSQEHYKEMTKPKTKVKKINSNNFFEQMQREKEAEAERRLEEQRLIIYSGGGVLRDRKLRDSRPRIG